MIKLISFVVIPHLFQFNQLKTLRQPGYLLFKLNQQYFFTVYYFSNIHRLKEKIMNISNDFEAEHSFTLH